MTIINDDGCVRLIAAIINPDDYSQSSGRKRKKKEILPELGEEWADLAAGILDIDKEVVEEAIK